jgi:hypothetical protein
MASRLVKHQYPQLSLYAQAFSLSIADLKSAKHQKEKQYQMMGSSFWVSLVSGMLALKILISFEFFYDIKKIL